MRSNAGRATLQGHRHAREHDGTPLEAEQNCLLVTTLLARMEAYVLPPRRENTGSWPLLTAPQAEVGGQATLDRLRYSWARQKQRTPAHESPRGFLAAHRARPSLANNEPAEDLPVTHKLAQIGVFSTIEQSLTPIRHGTTPATTINRGPSCNARPPKSAIALM